MINEDDYKKRYDEVNSRLSDPKISKKIDDYLKKIATLADCDVELNFQILPHMDDYSEKQESEDYTIPEYPTMKLSEFINHMNKEKDGEFDVYVDPIYLKSGVNEIIDVLLTTLDRKIIIVPISNNKKVKI